MTATKILNVWEILYVDGGIVMTRNSRIMTKRIVVEKALVLATVKKKKNMMMMKRKIKKTKKTVLKECRNALFSMYHC